MTMRTRSLLNADTGQSDIRGTFQVTNSTTGVVQVSGLVTAVGGEGGVAKGMLVGTVSGGGELIANYSVVTDFDTGGISGEVGTGSLVSTDLAIVQSGSCQPGS